MTIYKFSIFCITEGEVKFWFLDSKDQSPSKCPVDSTHKVDVTTIRLVDTLTDQAPVDTTGIPTVTLAPFSNQRVFFRHGNAAAPYVCKPDGVNIFDFKLDGENIGMDGLVQVLAGEYWTDDKIETGDYLDFALMDLDDLLGYAKQLGIDPKVTPVELVKIVKEEPLFKSGHGRIDAGLATKSLPKGLYLRTKVTTVASGVDRTVWVSYELAK